MQLTSLLVAATPANNRPLTIPPWPQTKTGQYDDDLTDRPMTNDPSCPILKPGPDCLPSGMVKWGPSHCWWAESNHIDQLGGTGLQCELQVCEWMTLEVHPLDRLLELEGTGGLAILYLGYVEVTLQIPGIKGYSEDVLQLVILTMTYSKKVPAMVGSKIIDRAMGMITKGELVRATMTWKQAHFGVVMSESLQHPAEVQGEMGMLQRGSLPLQPLTILCPRNFLWMMFRGMCIPHGGSPFLHLGP